LRKVKRRYKILLLITGILIIGVYLGNKVIESNLKELAQFEMTDIAIEELSDGYYKGSFSEFPISVEVGVTVSHGKIDSIDLLKHTNGQGADAEKITNKVIDAQSLQVDTISGATYSSKAIFKAVENALQSEKSSGEMSRQKWK